MCTATWRYHSHGYDLLFSRDEKRTRKPALCPTKRAAGGVRYFAPTDGDHGGTWIAVNEFGIAYCLLNRYPHTWSHPGGTLRSRGWLIPQIVHTRSAYHALECVHSLPLAEFAPFQLLVFESGMPASSFEWDGVEPAVLLDADSLMPVTSSSYQPCRVADFRMDLFTRTVGTSPLTLDALKAYHASHDPEAGAFSLCMHREDAETVSFSHIHVGESATDFLYKPAAPCQPAGIHSYRLTLRQQRAYAGRAPRELVHAATPSATERRATHLDPGIPRAGGPPAAEPANASRAARSLESSSHGALHLLSIAPVPGKRSDPPSCGQSPCGK
jgi:hypothetical protein